MSYSHMANATLPSALQRFTSVFGMGTGGSIALLPPGIFGSLISNSLGLVSNKSWKAVTSRSFFVHQSNKRFKTTWVLYG